MTDFFIKYLIFNHSSNINDLYSYVHGWLIFFIIYFLLVLIINCIVIFVDESYNANKTYIIGFKYIFIFDFIVYLGMFILCINYPNLFYIIGGLLAMFKIIIFLYSIEEEQTQFPLSKSFITYLHKIDRREIILQNHQNNYEHLKSEMI